MSFEPSEADRRVLALNLDANDLTNVVVESHAVAAGNGTVGFITYDSPGVGHIVRSDSPTDGRIVNVPTIALDDYLDRPELERLTFVKVDVEGGEVDVIDGASAMIDRHRPVFCVELRQGMTWSPVVSRFAERGYSPTVLDVRDELSDVLFIPD